ncbi:hypothetical protein [Candidatus Mycoplasma haematohominis]|uniref:hypothetical protein n=1 Tax=Candidatus Mycoplasma haematohominis TaxID=1494318 RepID=UPI001C0A7271|nr:hypothetical protein [Candidatus Mycoplasma haemohominis]
MASQAAMVGGGLLGATVIGVGSAYAAGAFTVTYNDFLDYANKNNFEYIGNKETSNVLEIKKLLDVEQNNSYRGLLKKHWGNNWVLYKWEK